LGPARPCDDPAGTYPRDTTMEVSIEYPDDLLEGLLTSKEQTILENKTSKVQVDKLRDLYSEVPEWISWEENDSGGQQQHTWVEFDNVRRDLFPRGTKPKNLINNIDFIKAINSL
jgi:hypothetical protein